MMNAQNIDDAAELVGNTICDMQRDKRQPTETELLLFANLAVNLVATAVGALVRIAHEFEHYNRNH